MPDHVVRVLEEALGARGTTLADSRVLVLGVAYKSDVADCRESPGLAILRLLRRRGARVAFHDALVPEVRLDGELLRTMPLTEDELRPLDAALIVTPHRGDDLSRIVRSAPLTVDCRNATADLIAQVPALANRIVRL